MFSTDNTDDIQFVATTTSQGYFANVGKTRRQGFDLALGGTLAALRWHASYSLVDATYRSSFEVNAEANSTADANGNIQIVPGNRIPLIPRNTGRLRLDYAVTGNWELGASAGRHLRVLPARQREQRQPARTASTSSARAPSAATAW